MVVSLAAAQVWAGFFLLGIGFAMHRAGPAFRRHPVGLPVALLGLALMLFYSEEPPEPELLLVQTITDVGPWFVTAVIATYLVLSGAPTYSESKPLQLLSGWIVMLAAWYFMLVAILPELTLFEILSWLSSIIGVAFAIVIFVFSVRYTESRTPVEPETTPLDEKERKYVQSVLRRHLEVSDES